MRLVQAHLDRLVCPVCLGRLILAESGILIACGGCGRIYPVVDGLPILLAERAQRVS
jgi:uncharacterized protein YbaR (Trm112 family)